MVKERYARHFRIDTTMPEHLKQKDKFKVVDKEDKRRKKVCLYEFVINLGDGK
jgi:hypothetical protein